MISYVEWWFDPISDFFTYDEKNKELGINSSGTKKNWERNSLLALELASANKIVSPTEWQRDQLPTIFKENCSIIFDGIDLKFFQQNNKFKNDRPTITYGTRGMDVIRGFPQFIRSLPEIIKSHNVDVEIAGNSENFYGNKPKGYKNWKIWAIDYLKEQGIQDYVKWKGFMKPKYYRDWITSSWCHVYLTHPFVASWSLVESLACGNYVIVSDVKATREFCRNLQGITYVDHRDSSKNRTRKYPNIYHRLID